MAIDARHSDSSVFTALVKAHNDSWRAYTEVETTFPHADITSQTTGDWRYPVDAPLQVTAATATNLATVILSANNSRQVTIMHFADALAHRNADTTNALTAPVATDQTTANTLLNQIKAKCNLHVSQATTHWTDDATNSITAPNATDLGTSQTLADAIKVFLNAHVIFAGETKLVKVID